MWCEVFEWGAAWEQSDTHFCWSMVSLSTALKKRAVWNYDFISQGSIWLWSAKELRTHVSFWLWGFKKPGFGPNTRAISGITETLSKKMFKPLMNGVCGSRVCRNWENVSWLLCWGFFLGMNHLLSPGFELTPWESTFGRFFNPNLWVLLAPKHCGNSFRNSGRLERERGKRSVQGKEREKFLKGLANPSNLLTNVVWVPSLQWNLKPGKFLVIWGSAMNILHSSR